MSKLILTTFVICVGMLQAIASSSNSFSVSTDENNFIVLNIDNVWSGEINIQIMDRSGVKIFGEIIQNEQVKRRKYDLTNLEDGDYILHVVYDKVIEVQQIKKEYNHVEVFQTEQSKIFKPSITTQNGFVDVNVLCFNGTFNIEVFDFDGNQLYEEVHTANGPYHQRYDLNTLTSGKYRFVVNMDVKNFDGSFEEKVIVASDLSSL